MRKPQKIIITFPSSLPVLDEKRVRINGKIQLKKTEVKRPFCVVEAQHDRASAGSNIAEREIRMLIAKGVNVILKQKKGDSKLCVILLNSSIHFDGNASSILRHAFEISVNLSLIWRNKSWKKSRKIKFHGVVREEVDTADQKLYQTHWSSNGRHYLVSSSVQTEWGVDEVMVFAANAKGKTGIPIPLW